MSEITEEQRKRIEENRQKAIQLRAAKQAERQKALILCPTANSLKQGKDSVLSHTDNNKVGLPQNTFYSRPIPSSSGVSGQPNKPSTSFTKGVSYSHQSISQSLPQLSHNPNKESHKTNIVPLKIIKKHGSVNGKVENFSKSATSQEVPSLFQSGTTVTGSCCLIERDRFIVDVNYNQQLIDIFKQMPSRAYIIEEKKWHFNLKDYDTLMTRVQALRPNISLGRLPTYVLEAFRNCTHERKIPEEDLSCVEPSLLSSLMPFQQEGVCFGISKKGRVLIADDMGLGKTIQALGIAHYYRQEWPLLIVTPSSVRYVWAESIYRWLPSIPMQSVVVIQSGKDSITDAKIVVITYDLVSRRGAEIAGKKFKVVIADESHFIKNQKAARTKALLPVLKKAHRVILLTGTPALSRPIELFTQLSAVDPQTFSNSQDFGLRYCGAKTTPWGWDFSGSSNMSELKLLLEEKVMIRRLKKDVLDQLPAKRRQMILLDRSAIITQTKEMKSCAKQLGLQSLRGMERRGALLNYFCETGKAKLKAICNYISDLLEAEKKFICFAHHKVVIDGICKTVEASKRRYICIDGSVAPDVRKMMCDRFQFQDDVAVAVLSITAANAGITLSAAHLVVFAELFWNPGILTQAEDRAHRIGQKDCVIVQYLVAEGTADDHLWPLVQRKLEVLNKAGLSKDNFTDSDTKHAKAPASSTDGSTTQNVITNYFEELFDIEEDEEIDYEVLLNAVDQIESDSKKQKLG